MNKVVLLGRMVRDPESRVTDKGLNICMYSLAVQRKNKNRDADFFNCVAFGKGAEFVEKWFKKGDKIAIVGHLQTSVYESEGRMIYRTEIVSEEHDFCEGKKPETSFDYATGEEDDFPF